MKIRRFLAAVPGALRATGRRFAADHLSAYAAQSTFYLMLSFFPFIMLICLATRLLPFLTEDTLRMLMQILLPADYHSRGSQLVHDYYKENIGSAKIVLIVFLIWTASRLIQSLMKGFNSSCGIVESRSQTVQRLVGCLYTIALCLILVAVIVMYALGSKLMALILAHAPHVTVLELILYAADRNPGEPSFVTESIPACAAAVPEAPSEAPEIEIPVSRSSEEHGDLGFSSN